MLQKNKKKKVVIFKQDIVYINLRVNLASIRLDKALGQPLLKLKAIVEF